MKRPNFVWSQMNRAFYYPSGHIAVTEEEMYASVDKMREWGAVAFLAAIAWMIYGQSRWFTA